MRNFLITTIVVVIIAAAALVGGYVYFLGGGGTPAGQTPGTQGGSNFPNTYTAGGGTSGQTQAQAKAGALAAFEQTLAQGNPDNIKPGETVVSGNYALQVWAGTMTGGEALLKYDTTQGWSVLDQGGGVWGVAALVKFGMNKTTALILLGGARSPANN